MDHPAQPMRSVDRPHYRGVRQHRKGKWVAKISDRKSKWIETFSTAEETALAYDNAAIALRGRHGKLNFPELFLGNDEAKHSTPKFDALSSHEGSTSQDLKQPQPVPEACIYQA